MSVIVYRAGPSYFDSLEAAEAEAVRLTSRPGHNAARSVIRMSVPYITSAVLAQILNQEPWTEESTIVARYRAGKKVDPR